MAVERKSVKRKSGDGILKELKKTNKLLREIRDILDNMWNEKRPGGE
jgi:hypothetical protein